jgi:hypothetical protein
MNNKRVVQVVNLLLFLCIPFFNPPSLAFGSLAVTGAESVEGTTWGLAAGDANITYKFKKNGVVTETYEEDGKKDTIEGTYTQDGDSIKMEFSDYTITAKIIGEKMNDHTRLEGARLFKADNTKLGFIAQFCPKCGS